MGVLRLWATFPGNSGTAQEASESNGSVTHTGVPTRRSDWLLVSKPPRLVSSVSDVSDSSPKAPNQRSRMVNTNGTRGCPRKSLARAVLRILGGKVKSERIVRR